MAEVVVPPDGDDRVARMDGLEKRVARTVRRAVMSDFEDVRALLGNIGLPEFLAACPKRDAGFIGRRLCAPWRSYPSA